MGRRKKRWCLVVGGPCTINFCAPFLGGQVRYYCSPLWQCGASKGEDWDPLAPEALQLYIFIARAREFFIMGAPAIA
jgi:hypothetical protein